MSYKKSRMSGKWEHYCEECGRINVSGGSFCESCIRKFIAERKKEDLKEQKRLQQTIRCSGCKATVTRKEQEDKKVFRGGLYRACLIKEGRCVLCGLLNNRSTRSSMCLSCKAHGREVLSRFR